MFLSFINNISLLLALSICHSFILKRCKPNTLYYQIASGILFGCITIAGMMNPFVMTEGIIFDGRSFVASIAGLMGGGITGIIVILIGGAYRIWGVGGGGTLMGVCVLATSAGLGVLYRYWRGGKSEFVDPLYLYCLGVIVNIVMLLWMFILPGSQVWTALSTVALPVMIIFPICTVVLGKMLQEQINSLSIQTVLKKSEEKYRELVENANSIILRVDNDGNITFFNEYAQKFFGYPEKEIIGCPVVGTIVPETESTGRDLRKITEQILNDPGKYSVYDNENICKNGARVWVSWTNKVILDENNHPTGLLCIGADITKSKKAEEEITKFRTISDRAMHGNSIVDLQGNIIYINDYFARVHGYTPEELIGRNLSEFHNEKQLETVSQINQSLIENGSYNSVEVWHTHKNGKEFPMLMSGIVIEDEGGNPKYMAASVIDITERKKAERALRESEELFRTIYENAPVLIDAFDDNGKCVLWNKQCQETFGCTIDEINSHDDVFSLFYPDPIEREEVKVAIVEHDGLFRECHTATKDGSILSTMWANFRLPDDTVICLGYDITEQKQADKALKDSEEHLRAIFVAADNVAFVTTDLYGEDAKILDFSPGAERIFGYSADEIIGRKVAILHLSDDISKFPSIQQHISNGKKGYSGESTLVRKSGEHFTALLTIHPRFDDSGEIVGTLGVTIDITDRKQAEEALLESESRLAVAQRIAHIGNWVWKIPKDELSWSDEIYKIFGLAEQEFAATDKAFLEFVHPDDVELQQNAVKKALNREEPYSIDHRIVLKNGEIRFVHEAAAIIFSDDGEPLQMIGTIQDITDRKRVEEELLKARKLESVGILAGGIAHDFNNLLMAIIGYISLAQTRCDSPEIVNEYLTEAQNASNRAQNLTQQLLTFSKGGSPVKEIANVIDLVKETATFSLRGSNVSCDFSFPDKFWQVDVDKGQFSQVIQNLVINADQAMPEGGIIEIKGENITFSDKNQIKDSVLREGDYIQLSVIDQGIGISKDHIQKIFDPYFTTKQKGNGLGLATTYSIIKNHQGIVIVESQIGVGTTFTIYLPRSLKDIVASNETNQEQLIKGQGRILIMDDEKMIRDVTGKMLKYLGYEVDYAEDGSKAIEQYKNASDSGNGFDVIIMDLTIPGGMGGKEAIQKLLEIDPQVKAIVSSGYSGDPIMSHYKKHGFSGVISKPYELESLGGVLHRVINESNP